MIFLKKVNFSYESIFAKQNDKVNTIMEQRHSGSGDNVLGDKIINLVISINPKYYIISIVALLLLFFGVRQIIRSHEPELLEVIVEGNDGNEISGANVEIFSQDDADEVISEGKTDPREGPLQMQVPKQGFFERIRWGGVSRSDIGVEFGGERFNFDSEEIKINKNNQVKLTIDTALSPFRVKYYNLNAAAVDFLLEGKVTDGKKTSIDNEGILNNLPFQYLDSLRRLFSVNASFDSFVKFQEKPDETLENWDKGSKTDIYTALPPTWYLGRHQAQVLYGTGYVDGFYTYSSSYMQIIHDKMTFDSMLLLLDMYDDWKYSNTNSLSLNRQNIEDINTRVAAAKSGVYKIARKIADANDLKLIQNRLHTSSLGRVPLDFLDYCIDKKFPDGFVVLDLIFDPTNWDCEYIDEVDYFYTRLNVFLPTIKFHVAVVENISDKQLMLSSVSALKVIEDQIREIEYDDNIFRSLYDKEEYVVNATLQPSEKFIIPLYCYFQHNEIVDGFSESKYIIGPSWKLLSANTNSFNYPVLAFDPTSIYVYGSWEGMGSCPYAYTYSLKKNGWKVEDHILFNLNSRKKKAYDTIALSSFDGNLMIRELDPEISFIDYIEVRCFNRETEEYYSFYPNNGLLHKVDNSYESMNTGDSLILKFPDFCVHDDLENFQLISNGYYKVHHR